MRPIKNRESSATLQVVKETGAGVPVVAGIGEAGIREMLFPDMYVIIPRSVERSNSSVWHRNPSTIRIIGNWGRQNLGDESAVFPAIFPVSREFGP
jgi:hypothetical protein